MQCSAVKLGEIQTFSIEPDDIETVNCRLCGSHDHDVIARVAVTNGPVFFCTSVCRRCGLVYRSTRPRLAWYVRAWNDRAVFQEQTGFNPFNEQIEEARYLRYERAANILRNCGAAGRVVDVASGPATGLRAYVDAGFEATGIEPDATRANYIHVNGVSMLVMTVEEAAETTRIPFDAASVIHALEHFHDPLAVLRIVSKMVRPGGLIYVEVPDSRQFVVDWNDALTLVHLTNFTGETLRAMGVAAGLSVECLTFPPADPPAQTHLGIVFRTATTATAEAVGNADWVASYRREVPECCIGAMQIVVPNINDLSLCHKLAPSLIKTVVHANFVGRRLVADNGVYQIVAGEKRDLP